jgi:indolepyruvate ferredoxin oxidoreductase
LQRELRQWTGVSALVYDQTCAAEKRRRRKKGEFADPPKRLFINEAVCEACGDCGVQSNCVSLQPIDTPLGAKRSIDQSSCNKDYSCVKGFCPSFVTIEGGTLRKSKAGAGPAKGAAAPSAAAKPSRLEAVLSAGGARVEPDPLADALGGLPAPVVPRLDGSERAIDATYNILINGIGGTGVITIGALIGMAAHLEGKGVSVLDMTGMSQKNGAVTSHVRVAATPAQVKAQRIATGEADLLLGCDMLTAGSADAIAKTRPGRTFAAINTHETPPGNFAQQRDWTYPADRIRALIDEAVGGQAAWIDATRMATALMGDSIATNLFMLGHAWQLGRVPISEEALMRAIELNGVAVESNKRAFRWGRVAAADPSRIEALIAPREARATGRRRWSRRRRRDGGRAAVAAQGAGRPPRTLDEMVAHRAALLTAYQDAAWAGRYTEFVARVRAAEDAALGAGAAARSGSLAHAVARNLAKLMAYKDEYEVARLHSDPAFRERLAQTFEGDFTVKFNLAPPMLAKRDANGHLVKREFGPWMAHAFRWLAPLKFLRGTAFDPFGRTAERKTERALIEQYRADIESLLLRLSAANHAAAVELAELPDAIRGFGHVKEAAMHQAARLREALLARLAAERTAA